MVVMIPLGVQGVEAALCEMILWPQLPDLPRWQVSGRGDLAELGRRVYDTTWRWQKDARVLSRDDVDLIPEILNGRFVPPRDPVAVAEDREERAQRLTAEQANLLKVTRLLPRVEIRGGAGSGKTVLAMQQARDLASGRLLGQKKRVAVVCYSYGLATFLRRSLLVGSASKRPTFVGTFEDLGRRWGITDFGSRDDSAFWEVDLPRRMADLAASLAHEEKFDAIIVDEAQASPMTGGRPCWALCVMRRAAACTPIPTSGSGCSPGSDPPPGAVGAARAGP